MSDWRDAPWYEFSARVTQAALFALYRLRVEGRRHVPPTGPLLIICNHQSFLDPLAVGAALLPRHISYLARKTLFQQPQFGRLLRSYRCVPIDQEGIGKDGLKTILEELRQGHAVLVFPEGERCQDGQMHEFRPGISLLVKRVQAPILPVGIAGAYEAWPCWRNWPHLAPWPLLNYPGIALSIGRPLDSKPYAGMERAAMLTALADEVKKQVVRAEHLRRAASWRR